MYKPESFSFTPAILIWNMAEALQITIFYQLRTERVCFIT